MKLGDAAAMLQNVKGAASIYVGVDPGTHTGLAVWDKSFQRFLRVESMKAVEAEVEIMQLYASLAAHQRKLMVIVEDTRKLRLPKHLQSPGRARGAGSVARDMGRWQEWLEHCGIPHQMAPMSPKEFRTGDDAWFRKKTGWDKRTNEHSRSAAGLVWMK